jgi:hypothetical protein
MLFRPALPGIVLQLLHTSCWLLAGVAALEYDLAEFTEQYVRDVKPSEDPKADPNHADFDPFHLPVPTLKSEFTAEGAFKRMDINSDGVIKHNEFTAVRESGMFHLPDLPVPPDPAAAQTHCICTHATEGRFP